MHNGHEPEVREACRDGDGIRDQDVSLKNCMRRVRGILTETYTLQVTMYNISVVKILQPLDGVRELEGTQWVTNEYGIVTYKLKVIASVAANILHDVAIGHPFRDHREPPILEGVGNPDEFEDVWMGQVLPHGHFFTEVLYDV